MIEHDSTAQGPNLATHRQPASVWERSGWDGTREQLAVSRLLVGVGGGALALHGLRSRSWTGRVFAVLGSSLAWWALTGEGDLVEARRWFGSFIENGRWRPRDPVHDASADSFPASDPPAWTSAVGAGPRRHAPGR
jgi:hypothetical protein